MLANKSTPAFARYIGIDYSGARLNEKRFVTAIG
jgi:hypothetical protein